MKASLAAIQKGKIFDDLVSRMSHKFNKSENEIRKVLSSMKKAGKIVIRDVGCPDGKARVMVFDAKDDPFPKQTSVAEMVNQPWFKEMQAKGGIFGAIFDDQTR